MSWVVHVFNYMSNSIKIAQLYQHVFIGLAKKKAAFHNEAKMPLLSANQIAEISQAHLAL